MDENSDVRSAQADGQGEKKGGGAGIILVILIVLIAVAVFFATQKKGPQMGTVMEIIPQQCVTFMQMDLDKAEDKNLREELWNKLKESPEFQKNLEEMKTKNNVDFEKDIMPWLGNQVTVSVMEAPKAAPKAPGEKPKAEKFVVIFSIKELEAAKAKVKEITGKEGYTEEKYGETVIMVPSKPDSPAMAFVKGLLVLGDKVEDVKAVIDTADGKAKGIKDNAAFMETVKKLPADSMGMMFVDMSTIGQTAADSMPAEGSNPAAEEGKKVLKSMKTMGIGVAMKNGNIIATGFMGIDKATDSVIMKTIIEKKPSLGDPASLKLFPGDTSYYGATDVTYIYDIIQKVVALQPNGQQQFETSLEQFKSQTGIDLQKDIIDNLSGELAYTLDFTDLMQSQMSGNRRQPPPVVIAIKVKDKAKMKDVLGKLTAKAGPMLTKSDYNGVELFSIPQGGGTFGIYEDFFLLGLGTAGSKLNLLIDNKMDVAKSMANLDGYKLIKDKINDKTISVGMVKFEKIMPIMELAMASGAAKDPKQAAAVKTITEYMKKYGELWSVSEVSAEGFKFDVIAIKTQKEEPKK